MGACDGGDLGVELGNWTPLGAASRGYFRERAGGFFVEGKDTPGKHPANILSAPASSVVRGLLWGSSSIP
jgi:hypothetical protein